MGGAGRRSFFFEPQVVWPPAVAVPGQPAKVLSSVIILPGRIRGPHPSPPAASPPGNACLGRLRCCPSGERDPPSRRRGVSQEAWALGPRGVGRALEWVLPSAGPAHGGPKRPGRTELSVPCLRQGLAVA